MFTREQWCYDLLAALGNLKPSIGVVDFVSGWSAHETLPNSGAKFNLLNTTQPAPGATDFNSVHVKNYVSYQQGIEQTVFTLRNGYYPNLSRALETDDLKALNVLSIEIMAELNTWCGGCGYGSSFIGLGAVHMYDQFNYGSAPEGEQSVPLQNYTSKSADFNHYFTQGDGYHWICKQTGKVVQYAILDFYKTLSRDGQSLPVIGLPTSNEIAHPVAGKATTFQFYERGVLCWNPDHTFDSQPGTGETYLAKIDDPIVAGLDPNRKGK